MYFKIFDKLARPRQGEGYILYIVIKRCIGASSGIEGNKHS